MKAFHGAAAAASVALAMVLAGCATAPRTVQVEPGGMLQVQAGDFFFDPDRIDLSSPGTLTLEVHNGARIQHNITVRDPQGAMVDSVNLPPGQTVRVSLALPVAGTYKMFCNKPFHATLGMRGQIVVGGS